MKLHYYQDPHGIINFGDDLNPWIWSKLLPEGFLNRDQDHLLVGIGTLLNDNLPKASKVSVFGSGVGYGTRPPNVTPDWHIYGLRGPLSAKALGVDEKYAITDGAYLLKGIITDTPGKKYGASYMPHFTMARPSLRVWCENLGIHYIDPSSPIHETLNDILETEFLLTEAMHGAIVADCFRVPWLPVKSSKTILDFKWIDWCSSLNIDYSPIQIVPLWETVNSKIHKNIINFSKSKLNEKIFKKTIKKTPRNLSKEEISRQRFEQLEDQLQAMVKKNA
jgi:succinoglycan biosynthesis protein ExoV